MRRFPVLLSILFLLTGCAAGYPAQQPLLTETEDLSWTLYEPGSTMEAATGSAVFSYPLNDISCTGILPFGDCLLLFTDNGDSTLLAQMDPETGCADTFLELPFPLAGDESSIHPLTNGFSCYDPVACQTLIIDESLQILRQIPAPEGLVGSPILSADGTTLYYCTESAVRGLDTASGISRILRESSYSGQQISALLLDDTVLQCQINHGTTLFLSTRTGATLGSSDRIIQTHSTGQRFFSLLREGNLKTLIFGESNNLLQSLILSDFQTSPYILFQIPAMIAVQPLSQNEVSLKYYDLLSGQHTASLTLPFDSDPRCFVAQENGSVWFLQYDSQNGCDTLCRWIPSGSPVNDTTVYTAAYSTREQPDEAALSQCLNYAAQLSQQFGLEIRIFKDAAAIQPPGFKLSHEHLAPVLMGELQKLERNLSHYPSGFLQTLAQRFDGLSICILRQISPAPEEAEGNGITFWDGHHPYIALAAGTDTEGAVYHELCHLIDTIVLNESSAYDTWNQLNPTGFEYDYDYHANRSRNSTAYLQDSSRYFVDMYSMSFPKEDRARIMECAMTEGNERLFQTEAMQSKLHTLCLGIRKAFHLTNSPETFLWEQYLHTPLAAKK